MSFWDKVDYYGWLFGIAVGIAGIAGSLMPSPSTPPKSHDSQVYS